MIVLGLAAQGPGRGSKGAGRAWPHGVHRVFPGSRSLAQPLTQLIPVLPRLQVVLGRPSKSQLGQFRALRPRSVFWATCCLCVFREQSAEDRPRRVTLVRWHSHSGILSSHLDKRRHDPSLKTVMWIQMGDVCDPLPGVSTWQLLIEQWPLLCVPLTWPSPPIQPKGDFLSPGSPCPPLHLVWLDLK